MTLTRMRATKEFPEGQFSKEESLQSPTVLTFSFPDKPYLQEGDQGFRSVWTEWDAEGRRVRSSKASSFCLLHQAVQLHSEPGHSVTFFPFQLFSRSSSSAWVNAAGPQ